MMDIALEVLSAAAGNLGENLTDQAADAVLGGGAVVAKGAAVKGLVAKGAMLGVAGDHGPHITLVDGKPLDLTTNPSMDHVGYNDGFVFNTDPTDHYPTYGFGDVKNPDVPCETPSATEAIPATPEVSSVFANTEIEQVTVAIQTDKCSGAIEMFRDLGKSLAANGTTLNEHHPLYALVQAAKEQDTVLLNKSAHDLAFDFKFWVPDQVDESALLKPGAHFTVTKEGTFFAFDDKSHVIASYDVNHGHMNTYNYKEPGNMLDSKPCPTCETGDSCVADGKTEITTRVETPAQPQVTERIIEKTQIVYVEQTPNIPVDPTPVAHPEPADLYQPPTPPEGVPCTVEVLSRDAHGKITAIAVDYHEASGRIRYITDEDVRKFFNDPENAGAFDSLHMARDAEGYVYDKGPITQVPHEARRVERFTLPNGAVVTHEVTDQDILRQQGTAFRTNSAFGGDLRGPVDSRVYSVGTARTVSLPPGVHPAGLEMQRPIVRGSGFLRGVGDTARDIVHRIGLTPQGDVYIQPGQSVLVQSQHPGAYGNPYPQMRGVPVMRGGYYPQPAYGMGYIPNGPAMTVGGNTIPPYYNGYPARRPW